MFSFLYMQGNYESRKVGRWEDGDRMVSTCSVNDGDHPYETAFIHPSYNGGKMVIVEAYDTKDAAKKGHAKWVKVMTKGPLPKVLKDCNNAMIAQLCAAVGCKREFKMKTAGPKRRQKRLSSSSSGERDG